MTRPVITKNKAGAYKRVTVECVVLDKEPLITLQRSLRSTIPGFKPKGASDLHLTVFHFGKPQELYRELKAKNPKLHAHDFWQHFWGLLARSADALSVQFDLSANQLAIFGNPQSPVLALEFEPITKLLNTRQHLEQLWLNFLARCEVAGLNTLKPFRPHVSLGRMDQKTELPTIDPITIHFSSSALRNVRPT